MPLHSRSHRVPRDPRVHLPLPPLSSTHHDKTPSCGSHTGLCQVLGLGVSPPDALRGWNDLATRGLRLGVAKWHGQSSRWPMRRQDPVKLYVASFLAQCCPLCEGKHRVLLSPKYPEPSTKLTPQAILQRNHPLCETHQSLRLQAGWVWKRPGGKKLFEKSLLLH